MTGRHTVNLHTARVPLYSIAGISALQGAAPIGEVAEAPLNQHKLAYERREGLGGVHQGKSIETVQVRRALTLAEYARNKRVRPQIHELAAQRNILDWFEEAIGRRFVVGEGPVVRLLYLALGSRFLKHPASIAMKGPSSCGKSFLTEQVLRFFPPSAYCTLTATSEKGLAYWEEPLEHRFIVLLEAIPLHGEMANYLNRTLQSEGYISYLTVASTDDGPRSLWIRRQGPTGLITTTTEMNLHPENETRFFSVEVDDTPEQTRRVLKAIAASENQGADDNTDEDIGTFVELQEWLEVANHNVAIPYAEALADKIPHVAPRLRRDFQRVLSLIKAHAILHQANRQVDERGQIIATLDDYRVVRDLVEPILSQGLQLTASDTMRQTVEAVREANARLRRDGAGASLKQVAETLNLHKSVTSRRVDACLERGYLRNLNSKRGSAYQLVVGDQLPGEVQVLPDAESLEGCCSVAADPGGIGPPPPCSDLFGSVILETKEVL